MNNLTIIVPTYNEADNIPSLVRGIHKSVPDADILVVDDNSPDGTADIAESLGCHVIRRTENRGLSASVIDGLRIIDTTDIVVIMDADLSHSPEYLPSMVQAITIDGYDIAIGSRFIPGGSTPDWSANRRMLSRIGTTIMQLFTGVRDMNSGFVAFKRSIIDVGDMQSDSWKILFEIFFKGRWDNCIEIPIAFHDRRAGISKFNTKEMLKGMVHFGKMLVQPRKCA